MLCSTAIFAVMGPVSGTAHAEDAKWNGDQLYYEANEYEKEQPSPLPASDSRDRAGEVAYTWIETLSNGDQKAHTIFFDNASKIQAEDEAVLIIYDYESPDTYTNRSTPQVIGVSANPLGPEIDNEDAAGTTCSGDATAGLGWVLCPVSHWLSEAVDWLYGIVADFLEVPKLATTEDQSGMYELWSVMRAIANVAFVVAFLFIIYSQITGAGISNYGIKSMLPRLIVAAILVNVSYWICALLIDTFNIIGYSLQSVLVNIRENISIDNVDQLSWTNLTNGLLAGGGTVLAVAGFSISLGGSPGALFFMLLAGLVSIGFALFVAFVVLAARQALIVVLVVISPLAFVAYLLPNTEEYFAKWRKALLSLLLFFPIFALLFGGSQLAGLAVIQRGIQFDQLHVIILGLAVQAVPLFITPLIVQFSQGVLGRIANMANNAQKGPVDGIKNALRSRSDYHKMKALGTKDTVNPFTRFGQFAYRRNANMERRKKAYEDLAQSSALATKNGQKSFDLEQEAEEERNLAQATAEKTRNERVLADPELVAKDLKVRLAVDQAALSKEKLEVRWGETKAGEAPQLTNASGLSQKQQKSFDSAVSEINRYSEGAVQTAHELAATGVRKVMAQEEEAYRRAQAIKDQADPLMIGEELYTAYASGIKGEQGKLAVTARAKAEVSKVLVEDTKLMHDAIDLSVSGDPALSYQHFEQASTITERISHMMSFATQGTAGDANIRKAMVEMSRLYDEAGEISREEFHDFKELTSSLVNGVMSKGEDTKRFIGNPDATFSAIVSDPKKSWYKGSAQSFASSDPMAQIETLKAYAAAGDKKYTAFIDSLTPELYGMLKDEVKTIIGQQTIDAQGRRMYAGGLSSAEIVARSQAGGTADDIDKILNKYRDIYN